MRNLPTLLSIVLPLSVALLPAGAPMRSTGGERTQEVQLCAAAGVSIAVSPLPQSARLLEIEISSESTAEAYALVKADADAGAFEGTPTDEELRAEALSTLLSGTVPEALAAREDITKELIGEASLHEEGPAALLSRFVPGELLRLQMRSDAWPALSLRREQYMALPLTLPRPAHNETKLQQVWDELRARYPLEDGEQPDLDDALATRVADGLTFEALDTMVRDRLKRESAIEGDAKAYLAVEAALLEALSIEVPQTLLVERGRQQYSAVCTRARDAAAAAPDDESLRKEAASLLSWEAFQSYMAKEGDAIERAMALSFALQAVADTEGVKPDPQAVDDNFNMYWVEFKKTHNVELDREDAQLRERFEAEYMRDTTLRFLLDHAAVEWA